MADNYTNISGLSPLVSLVGSGPGAVDLLTIRGLNRIKEADIILYDALITEPLLKEADPKCEIIYTGKLFKDGQDQQQRQEKIHELMAHYYNKGLRVIRLKSGDPMIFGRGMEEINFLESKQIPWEVVPGVTSGIAAAGLHAIPLTQRGKSRLVLFTTAYTENGDSPEETPWIATLKDGGSVVFYMALSKLEQLVKKLHNHQLETTMVAICNNISQENEITYRAKAVSIIETIKDETIIGPSLVILYHQS